MHTLLLCCKGLLRCTHHCLHSWHSQAGLAFSALSGCSRSEECIVQVIWLACCHQGLIAAGHQQPVQRICQASALLFFFYQTWLYLFNVELLGPQSDVCTDLQQCTSILQGCLCSKRSHLHIEATHTLATYTLQVSHTVMHKQQKVLCMINNILYVCKCNVKNRLQYICCKS